MKFTKELEDKIQEFGIEELSLEDIEGVSGGKGPYYDGMGDYWVYCDKQGCRWRASSPSEKEAVLKFLKHMIRHQQDPDYIYQP